MNPAWVTVSILGATAIAYVAAQNVAFLAHRHTDVVDDPVSAPLQVSNMETLPQTVSSPVDSNDDLVVIDTMMNYYGPVFFAHELHAEMAAMENGCAVCHHQEPVEGVIQACAACHDSHVGATLERPSLKGAYHRQCLGCHRDWAHENACDYCHLENGSDLQPPLAEFADPTDFIQIPHPRISAEPVYNYHTTFDQAPIVSFHHTDHASQFGLKCVDCHQNDSCTSCHDTNDNAANDHEQISHIDRCLSCHSDRNCRMCHAENERPVFAHATESAWSLEPYHVDVSCQQCHGQVSEFLQVSPNCLGCHSRFDPQQFDHARVTGVALLGSHAHFECTRCHVGNQATSYVATCSNCHADREYPRFIPGNKQGSEP